MQMANDEHNFTFTTHDVVMAKAGVIKKFLNHYGARDKLTLAQCAEGKALIDKEVLRNLRYAIRDVFKWMERKLREKEDDGDGEKRRIYREFRYELENMIKAMGGIL